MAGSCPNYDLSRHSLLNRAGTLPFIMPKPIVAIDATLAFGMNTGDSTYWTGLLAGLSEADSPFDYLLLSHQPKPDATPFKWKHVSGGHRRWRSLVAMPMAARRAGATVYHTQYTLSPLARNGVTTSDYGPWDASFRVSAR